MRRVLLLMLFFFFTPFLIPAAAALARNPRGVVKLPSMGCQFCMGCLASLLDLSIVDWRPNGKSTFESRHSLRLLGWGASLRDGRR